MNESEKSLSSAKLCLDTFFEKLNDANCDYAVIHQSLEIDKVILGDVDIVLDRHPNKVILPIVNELIRGGEVKLIQNLHYEIPYGYYYILQILGEQNSYLHLDCLYDECGINRYRLKTTELLDGAIKTECFRHTSSSVEASYLLIKRTIKGHVDHERFNYLQEILEQNWQQLLPLINDWYGVNMASKVYELISATNEDADKLFKLLKIAMDRRFKKKHPFRFISSICLTKYRQLKRLAVPTGLFVVILGPDGCGKSTITNALSKDLQRGYRNIWQFHWRPGLLPKLGQSNSSGSSNGKNQNSALPTVSKYKGIVSLVRFVYYWLDFVIGYWLKIYPKKAQTTLVIGERYFPDVLVNPVRYGFSVSPEIMRLAAKCVPQADVIILLEDDPVVINVRKDELSIDAIADLLDKYKKELLHWQSPVIINTSRGVDDVIEQVKNVILDKTSQQTVNRLTIK